ncbi:MAG: hypothetical protein LBH04_05110 [Tannerellaceae bacterium]|jgi:uncharacterized protein (TIGR00661 family)|nr:hypothetical protein [Tannerellaceae bacterium]
MKCLFIIQGEGRGHITQAISLLNILKRNGHEVVETLIGKGKSREVPAFVYEKLGANCRIYDAPCFIFKKNQKHVNFIKTFLFNTTPKRLQKYNKSIELIKNRIDKCKPDVIVNFYEVLSGLAHLRFNIKIPFVNIGHQYLARHHSYLHARGEEQSLMIFRLHTLMCNIDATKTLALSFYPMKEDLSHRITVVPPLLRNEALELVPEQGDFILGYMVNPGYEKEIIEWHELHPDVKLRIFWDKKNAPKVHTIDETLTFYTLDDELFVKYMASCKGYISTAGFESICEAIYLGKPVMVIPTHIEQQINARDASSTEYVITGDSFDISRLIYFMENYSADNKPFKDWVNKAEDIFIEHIASLNSR